MANKHAANILIVDDDISMRLLMRASLESTNYNIIEAENGLQALQAFEKHDIDIVLLDIQMPTMDGFTACRELRKSTSSQSVPILMTTGLDDLASIEEAYLAGATDFITKPIDWLILEHRIRYMLRASNAFQKVRKQEASLAQAQRIANLGNWEFDIQNNKIIWSKEVYRIYEMDQNDTEVSLQSILDSIHPDDRHSIETTFWSSLKNNTPYRKVHRILVKNKKVKYVESHSRTYYDNNQRPVSVIGTVQDITERMLAEERINTLSQALEQSPVSVMITDTNGLIRYVNQSFEEITGYLLTDVRHQHCKVLNPETTPDSHYKELWTTIKKGEQWHGELHNQRKDGSLFWLRVNIAPVYNEAKSIRNFIYVGEDITLYKEQEQQILRQAHFDTLTQLPNRFLVLDRLSQSIREAHRYNKKVAVIFIDLDYFKKINDSLGHDVGDKVLIEAAQRLTSLVREQDTVGRLGGDEFIITLADLTDEDQVLPIAENILKTFQAPLTLDQREFVLTASVGISVYPNDGTEPAELLRKADTAMYKSKEDGRNTFSFITEAMNRGVARKLELEEQLRRALEKEEFSILFQPLVSSQQHRVMGAEALLRWDNETLNAVSPEEFIPIAEQSGIIISIGRYVLKKSLEFAKHIRQTFLPDFTIAVNISPVQFRDKELTSFISSTLKTLELPGSILSLEITEGVLLSGHTYVSDTLTSVHKLGVSFAMDDFGTGYSSFNYLRGYPFSTLKIDKSYIDGLSTNANDKKLVNSIISMSHGLDLKVVAEGVESEQQLAYLKKQNCDLIQGYYVSLPLNQEEFCQFLTNRIEIAPQPGETTGAHFH